MPKHEEEDNVHQLRISIYDRSFNHHSRPQWPARLTKVKKPDASLRTNMVQVLAAGIGIAWRIAWRDANANARWEMKAGSNRGALPDKISPTADAPRPVSPQRRMCIQKKFKLFFVMSLRGRHDVSEIFFQVFGRRMWKYDLAKRCGSCFMLHRLGLLRVKKGNFDICKYQPPVIKLVGSAQICRSTGSTKALPIDFELQDSHTPYIALHSQIEVRHHSWRKEPHMKPWSGTPQREFGWSGTLRTLPSMPGPISPRIRGP
ncbi:hypothetical protein BDN72DRAFT_906448 [Pluteus cervinus]|uniref:Uncharacterized protein n=1 Tax=Pluteus cervinus TaxID=181527 RepID=A0ACD2ZZ88_9AGAR|nr:hypothetical protein BDN72DRAFT_906448 [Pluteus cervinus]